MDIAYDFVYITRCYKPILANSCACSEKHTLFVIPFDQAEIAHGVAELCLFVLLYDIAFKNFYTMNVSQPRELPDRFRNNLEYFKMSRDKSIVLNDKGIYALPEIPLYQFCFLRPDSLRHNFS